MFTIEIKTITIIIIIIIKIITEQLRKYIIFKMKQIQ